MHCVKTPDANTRSALRAASVFVCVFFMLYSCEFAQIATAATTKIIHPGPESTLDTRSKYDWIVLHTALERTRAAYGNFEEVENFEPMNPARQLLEMAKPSGRINLIVKVSSIELEKTMLPIRLPFDFGIRGYRVLLIRTNTEARFTAINNIKDLSSFSFGLGDAWSDVDILNAAGLKVIKSHTYSNLFQMLSSNQVDALPRAIDEALTEIEDLHQNLPDLMVEPRLLLYYPMPRYFFVRRDAEGEHLAKRIEAGLEAMIADGSLRALFEKHKGELITRSKLKSRQLLSLPNPFLPAATPLSRKELWYTPFVGK